MVGQISPAETCDGWQAEPTERAQVETLKEPGRYSDGGNLYLSISSNGGKRWIFSYRFGAPKPGSKNNRYELGLGSAAPGEVSLKDARIKADEARRLLNAGTDPISVMGREAKAKAERTIPAFGSFADEYIKSHRPKFRNEKHAAQWEMTLGDAYCKAIRPMPVNAIDTEAILKVLQPIWQEVPETASRLEAGLRTCWTRHARAASAMARTRRHGAAI